MTIPIQPFGYVAGRWVLAIGDTVADEDREPDYVPVKTGKIMFTPLVSHRVAADLDPASWVGIVNTPVEGKINSDGRLVDAHDEPHLALAVGRYRVAYSLNGATWPTHEIVVKTEHTLESPLWVPTESPLPTGPGVVQVVSEATRIAAEAAAARAETSASLAGEYADSAEASALIAAAASSERGLSVDTTVGTRVLLDYPGGTLMLYGDTGHVDALPFLQNGWKQWNTFPLTLRRVGNRVYLQGMIDGNAQTAGVFLHPPVGFRASSASVSYPGTLINWNTGANAPAGAAVTSIRADRAAPGYYTAPLAWDTNDPWPTT